MNELKIILEHIFKPLIADRFDLDAVVNSFLDGIAPRHPASLLHDSKAVEDRARWFWSVIDKSDTDIEAQAEAQVMIDLGYDQPSASTLVRSLGAKRLRTVPPKLLITIAKHYSTWRPVVEALTNPEKVSPDLEAELKRLLDRLVNIIPKSCKHF